MEQQVSVGSNGLAGQFGELRPGARGQLWDVASGATRLVEKCLAPQHEGIGPVPSRGHSQRARVTHYVVQYLVARFGRLAARLFRANLLARGIILLRHQRGSDADVLNERGRGLFQDGGLLGLPAKPAGIFFPRGLVPNKINSAGNTVAIAIVRIGERPQSLRRHCLQQTHPHHGRRDARRHHQFARQRAIAQVANRISRLAK